MRDVAPLYILLKNPNRSKGVSLKKINRGVDACSRDNLLTSLLPKSVTAGLLLGLSLNVSLFELKYTPGS